MNSTRQQTRRNSDAAPAGGAPPAHKQPGAAPGTGQTTMPPRRTWLWFVLILLANFLLMRFLMPGPPEPITVPYTLFKEEVRKGNVKAIFSRGEISAKPIQEESNPWVTLLFGFGPALLLILFYVWMFRRAQQGGGLGGGLMGIGRSRARRYDQAQDTKVSFDDVAGIDEAENELVEIVDFLKDPPKYTRLGGTAPKGVLLVGAPGTGKTLLAKAVVGEAGVPFFSMSDMHLGALELALTAENWSACVTSGSAIDGRAVNAVAQL